MTKTATKTERTKTDEPVTDPAGAVAGLLTDTEPAPSSAAERMRRHRAKKKAEAEKGDAATVEPLVVTPGDVGVATTIGDVLWGIAGPQFRLRPLNDEQRERLGMALAPLVAKYAPLMGRWQYECMALLTIMALARECHIPKTESEDAGEPRTAPAGEEGKGDDA